MDEIMMKEYLRNGDMSDHEVIMKLKEVLGTDRNRMSNEDTYYNRGTYRHSDSQLRDILDELSYEDKTKLISMMGISRNMGDSQAKDIVSQMYHTSGGRKYIGEKYDMQKAKEILNRYSNVIPQYITVSDVYMAINSQYHDYCDLFKAWFGDNIDSKIIESAITFWFKDVDYKHGNKVHKYFES